MPEAPRWLSDHDAQDDEPGVRDRRVGEHPLHVGLGDADDRADQHRGDATTHSTGRQVQAIGPMATEKTRSIAAKAATLVQAAMNAVTGVGAPW